MSITTLIKSTAKKSSLIRYIWYKYKLIKYVISHPDFKKINRKDREGYVIQLVNTLSPKDAIGNSVLEISRELSKRNIKNCILYFGSYTKEDNSYPVNIFKLNTKDTILYHIGCGSKLSEIYYKANVKKKILVYHNITPSKYFYDNPTMVKDIEKGRKQLEKLQECTDLGICMSKYSEEELIKLNYKRTEVLSLPTRVPELLKFKKDRTSNTIDFITVGRVVRHKCIHDVISLFNEIYKINNESTLNIIGGCDNMKYLSELNDLINKYGLNNKVSFVHNVSEEKLAEFYSNASGYLCMSEHEGFCVPLIEAMAFNVPIFAYSSSAIPGTLNGSGILFKDKLDFKSMAKTIMSILNNEEEKNKIISKENERYKDFNNQDILNNYVKAIMDN